MKINDLSEYLTVFVIDCNNPNYLDCLESLSKQTVGFKFKLIRNVSPLSVAFQKMLDECDTKYFCQIDSDFVLEPTAIEYLYDKINEANNRTAFYYCMLRDKHLDKDIFGIRIYNHEIVRNFPFNLNHPSCEVEQSERLIAKNYKCIEDKKVIGEHSPKWTSELIFRRYKGIAQKQNFFQTNQGYYDIKYRLVDKLAKNKNSLDLSALLGYLTGKYANEQFNEEKNIFKPEDKYEVLKEMFSLKSKDTRLNILFLYDVYGWVFHFETMFYTKWSSHNVVSAKFDEVKIEELENYDLIIIPGSCHYRFLRDKGVIRACKQKNVKIVVQYNSEIELEMHKDIISVDLIVASSKGIYNTLVQRNSKNVVFIPHNVDTTYFVPKNKWNNFTIGWAGNKTEPVKNYNLLEKLKYPVVVKSDWGKETFVKDRTQDDMIEFYNDLDIYLCLSKSEGSPYGILEAMSCGKICLGTNTGIIPQVLSKWFIIDQTQDIVEQVNYKLDYLKSLDKETLIQLGIENRLFIEKSFAWWHNIKLLDDTYSNLIKGK